MCRRTQIWMVLNYRHKCASKSDMSVYQFVLNYSQTISDWSTFEDCIFYIKRKKEKKILVDDEQKIIFDIIISFNLNSCEMKMIAFQKIVYMDNDWLFIYLCFPYLLRSYINFFICKKSVHIKHHHISSFQVWHKQL